MKRGLPNPDFKVTTSSADATRRHGDRVGISPRHDEQRRRHTPSRWARPRHGASRPVTERSCASRKCPGRDAPLPNGPEARVDWRRCGVKPYRRFVYAGGNERRFKPAGDRGTQFRNVHVNHAVFDEAAVPTNAAIWGELSRACLPGCEVRIYSVPDGNQTTEYARLKRTAVSAESYLAEHPEAADPLLAPLPNTPEAITREEGQPELLKFRWSKPMMPPPHWTTARWRKYIVQFGGVD